MANPESGGFSAYLTPDESRDIHDEPESLIALRINLNDNESATLADDPVEVSTLTDALVPAVAHCDYDSSAGIDHSITHRTGQNKPPGRIAGYLVDRLTRWATDEVVADAAADHEDGWIVDALAELGEDESLPERVEAAVTTKLDGKTTALTTVKVQPPDAEKYFYPGELATESAELNQTDVFQVAMRARKLSKLVDKNAADDSQGEAVDLLTGEGTQTVGMAEDPLNYFLGKQHESFPGLDPEEAWRAHPLSEDSAVMLIASKTFVNACSYGALNMRVYYLPYFFGRPTVEKVLALYDILYAVYQNDDLTPVEQAYQSYTSDSSFGIDSSHELRFYVGAIQYQHENRFDVFGDTIDGSLMYPVDLSNAHEAVVESPVFDDAEFPRTAPLPTHPDWGLLTAGTQLRSIATGWYLTQTFPDLASDEEISSDDYRIKALVNILSGEPLLAEELLQEYTEAITNTDGDDHPSLTIASQFAQLSALAEAGLLDTNDSRYEPLTKAPTYDSPTTMTQTDEIRADGGHAALEREMKLESFIDGTPAIREDPRRKAAFLLGALIGHISGYQESSEGRATTLVDQHPIKGLTVRKFKRTLQEAIDKDVVYSRDNRMSSTMYAEVVDELRAAVADSGTDPDEWEIDTTDLRFYYSLGVTYGLNDYEPNEESSDEPTDDAEEA
ncbi:type I-B CRISPR-associated protein Cas8b/Csh1 [Haloarcula sp. JP-L23]|uniref:type I-B CRISPR-associated protein Cas8b/Csh1 n=1 Tax=Haloarcula sp. JP-L23 TaxID=2716717 RepID=UPI0032E3E679